MSRARRLWWGDLAKLLVPDRRCGPDSSCLGTGRLPTPTIRIAIAPAMAALILGSPTGSMVCISS